METIGIEPMSRPISKKPSHEEYSIIRAIVQPVVALAVAESEPQAGLVH